MGSEVDGFSKNVDFSILSLIVLTLLTQIQSSNQFAGVSIRKLFQLLNNRQSSRLIGFFWKSSNTHVALLSRRAYSPTNNHYPQPGIRKLLFGILYCLMQCLTVINCNKCGITATLSIVHKKPYKSLDRYPIYGNLLFATFLTPLLKWIVNT